jgi:hypothetical protein
MGREARKGARVIACRSIEPEQSLGPLTSPFPQGWDQRDLFVVGIDVSKDRLDVTVCPTGESVTFRRTGVGIDDLIARLKTLAPKMIAIEATSGFETVVAGPGWCRPAGRGPASPVNDAAKASSVVVAKACVAPCSSVPWSLLGRFAPEELPRQARRCRKIKARRSRRRRP